MNVAKLGALPAKCPSGNRRSELSCTCMWGDLTDGRPGGTCSLLPSLSIFAQANTLAAVTAHPAGLAKRQDGPVGGGLGSHPGPLLLLLLSLSGSSREISKALWARSGQRSFCNDLWEGQWTACPCLPWFQQQKQVLGALGCF